LKDVFSSAACFSCTVTVNVIYVKNFVDSFSAYRLSNCARLELFALDLIFSIRQFPWWYSRPG